MIRTATAAENAAVASPVDDEPAGERREREREHDRDEDARDAVDEPLDRRLARLRLGDEPRDLRERGLLADLRRAHDEPAERVDRRAGDVASPAPTSTGTGSPVSIDWSTADVALDDDAVGRDLLAGPDDEEVADARARRSGPRPPRRRAGRAPPSRRARAARGSPRPSGAARAPRGSGRAGSAS